MYQAYKFREHLTFAAKLEIGGRRQETGDRRKEEERRSQKKSFYKYEMLPQEITQISGIQKKSCFFLAGFF